MAANNAGDLIKGLTSDQRVTVQTIISRGIRLGWSDSQVQKRLESVVGLDKRYAQAVENFRQKSLKDGQLPPGVVEKEAKKYADRLRAQRASTIARYEIQKALNDANRLIWQQMAEDGDLSPYAVRVWRVHKDERRCPVCRRMNGVRASLKKDGTYNVRGTPMIGPPVHPNCRCWEELVDRGEVVTLEKAAKIRRVRTPAGAKHFGAPIGTPIVPGMAGKKGHPLLALIDAGHLGGGEGAPVRGRVVSGASANKLVNRYKPTGEGYEPSELKHQICLDITDRIQGDEWTKLVPVGNAGIPEHIREMKITRDYLDEKIGPLEFIERLPDSDKEDLYVVFDDRGNVTIDWPGQNVIGMLRMAEERRGWIIEDDLWEARKRTPGGANSEVTYFLSNTGFDDKWPTAQEMVDRLDHWNDSNTRSIQYVPASDIQGIRKTMDSAKYRLVKESVARWAETSNDHNPQALAMQELAARIFHTERHQSWESDVSAGEVQEYLDNPAWTDFATQFLQAQYEMTQKHLADSGVTSVVLYRGFKLDRFRDDHAWGTRSPGEEFTIRLRPISSFSSNEDTARGFAGTDPLSIRQVIKATIPAEDILSVPATGLGCLEENEFVVIHRNHRVVNLIDNTGAKEEADPKIAEWLSLEDKTDEEVINEVFKADAASPIDDLNEDWIKSLAWDLDVETVDELEATIWPTTLSHFMTLPAARPMPKQLKKDALRALKERAGL